MKRIFALIFLLLASLHAQAVLVTATFTVTNVPNFGSNYTLNGSTRMATNAQTSSTFITNLISTGASTTNIFRQVDAFKFPGIFYSYSASNVIQFRGSNVVITVPGAWASVTYATNSGTETWPILVPPSNVIGLTNRTNNASWIVDYLNRYSPTNFIEQLSGAMVQFLNLGQIQTFTNKTSRSSTNIGGFSTNQLFKRLRIPYSATETNALAFESGGTIGSFLEPDAFGIPKLIQVSDGDAAEPTDPAHILTLKWANAIYPGLGYTNSWSGTNFFQGKTWFNLPVHTTNSLGIGNTNSGGLYTNGVVGSATMSGTNIFTGAICLKAVDLPSLSFPGPTHNVAVSSVPIYEISGATGNFSIDGFAVPSSGTSQAFWIINPSAFNMTLVHNAGDPAASNRILSLTGADLVTNGAGAAYLWYSFVQSKWIVLQFSP